MISYFLGELGWIDRLGGSKAEAGWNLMIETLLCVLALLDFHG